MGVEFFAFGFLGSLAFLVFFVPLSKKIPLLGKMFIPVFVLDMVASMVFFLGGVGIILYSIVC